jgi:integrative and conjugative element protein (TIGR02256 family)
VALIPPANAWIGDVLWREITAEVASKHPRETGGVLVGYWTTPLELGKGTATLGRGGAGIMGEVVITAAIGPGPKAVHLREEFVPDHDFHEGEVARVYRQSGRIVQYLGDWHSHPKGPTTLSKKDIRTLVRIMRAPRARAPRPLMLIVQGKDVSAARCWCLSQWPGGPRWFGKAKLSELELRVYSKHDLMQ